MQRRRVDHARAVWAALSTNPRASHRELMAELHISHGALWDALCLLKDQGYIRFPKFKSRAITVVVPFVVQEFE